jgi:hypothetical protein
MNKVKQSKFEDVPKLPCRSILLGPSGSREDHIIAKFDITESTEDASKGFIYFRQVLMLIPHGYL